MHVLFFDLLPCKDIILRKKILIVIPSFIPSTIIGVLRPLSELERLGEVSIRLRLSSLNALCSLDVDWCDVAVFCRNCEIGDLSILYDLKRKNKRIVYEIDDNFEEIPLTTDIGIYHRSFFRLHVLKRFVSISDVTRVYSERLLLRVEGHGARPQLIRSYFDRSLVNGLSKRESDGVMRIAYPTGRIDDKELEGLCFGAVRMILEKYPGKVEFHLWRKAVPIELIGVRGVVLNEGIKGYDNFIRAFFSSGFDIGLAPGVDVPFFHSKTNNKYREFGGCGIAGVYSNFPPYSNSVVHEHTGLLAENSRDGWAAAIERLLLDEGLRSHIVKNAEEDVFKNYSFESAVNSWRDCLRFVESQEVVVPSWLPSDKNIPLFSFICLGAKLASDKRADYLQLSCQNIPRAVLERFDKVEDYLKSSFRRIACACVFIVNDDSGLQQACDLITLSMGAVVDLTFYSGDADAAIARLLGCASSVAVNFLVTAEQARGATFARISSDCWIEVEPSSSYLYQEFSLSGYPAAYLDSLERHVCRSPLTVPSGYFSAVLDRWRRVADRYHLWKGRFETLVVLMKWRIGLRKF